MGGHGDVGRAPDDLVAHVPFVVGGVALGEVEGSRDDADGRVAAGEAAAEVLEMGPVVAVEALADLRTHVGEEEGLVHGSLAPARVGGGDLVAAVVAGPEVVLELRPELVGHRLVLQKYAVLPVPVPLRQRCRRDVLNHPVRVAQAPVVRGDQGRSRGYVGDGAGKSVLEEAGGVDGRGRAAERGRGGGGGEPGRG